MPLKDNSMANQWLRFGFRRRSDRVTDWLALPLAVVVTGAVAVAAAWWYRIGWRDITDGGPLGLSMFVFMFAMFAGMPAYCLVRVIRIRRRIAMRNAQRSDPLAARG